MEFINENKGAIIFSVLLMLIGSFYYFWINNSGTFEGARFKINYDDDGSIIVFANSKNNAMAKLKAIEGESIPEDGSIVFGNSQAVKFRSNEKFNKVGDKVVFFDQSLQIGGVLSKNSPIDELIFLSSIDFNLMSGESDRIYSKMKMSETKLFYRLMTNETISKNFILNQGDMSGYATHNLDGTEFYPLILGSKEAKVMREEKLFTNTGDSIRDLFGKNFVVAGVLEESDTIFDYMHFVPLYEEELKN